MNIKPDVVRSYLDERGILGRTPVEAAGEVRWTTHQQESMGILSHESHDDMLQVIDEWLAERLNVPLGDVGMYSKVADFYAQFLAERVHLDDFTQLPTDQIDTALKAWRESKQ